MLTLFSIQNAKPRETPYKLSDGRGLHLLVSPNGSKLWRLRYRFDGTQKMLSLGSYSDVSLASARTKRNEARTLLADGTGPSQQKKQDKLAAETAKKNTFGVIADEHLQNLGARGRAEATIIKHRWFLKDLAAPLTDRPISEITPKEILDILKKLEARGLRETAKKPRRDRSGPSTGRRDRTRDERSDLGASGSALAARGGARQLAALPRRRRMFITGLGGRGGVAARERAGGIVLAEKIDRLLLLLHPDICEYSRGQTTILDCQLGTSPAQFVVRGRQTFGPLLWHSGLSK